MIRGRKTGILKWKRSGFLCGMKFISRADASGGWRCSSRCCRAYTAPECCYVNGHTDAPSYADVCRGGTGYAEAVRVIFDDGALPLPKLLEMFYSVIDPTSLNRQGGDAGSQYRTGVFYLSDADRPVIEASLQKLQARCDRPVRVACEPARTAVRAEEYHQKYLEKNPQGYCHIGAAAHAACKGDASV